MGLRWYKRYTSGYVREARVEHPEWYPHPIHPEPGGMVPFGHTAYGDSFYDAPAGGAAAGRRESRSRHLDRRPG